MDLWEKVKNIVFGDGAEKPASGPGPEQPERPDVTTETADDGAVARDGKDGAVEADDEPVETKNVITDRGAVDVSGHNTRPPKYPVALVHGMMLKSFKTVNAFGMIPEYLEEHGIKAFVTNQDGVGSIENNAAQLKDEILGILEKEGVNKINLIAHSKGGIDARYMITKLGMDEHVASLTTLSTPHRGSKVSAMIMRMPQFIIKQINRLANFSYKLVGDKNPDLYRVGEQLCDTAMAQFNKDVPDDDRVYYQSYSSLVGEDYKVLLMLPLELTRHIEAEETDGIVSQSSAMWGTYRGVMDVDASHTQMVGVSLDMKKVKEVGDFYLRVIDDLTEMGF